MSSAPLKGLFASTSFRLSLVFAAVLFLAFVLAGVGLWFVTKSAAEQAGRQRIQSEMESLQAEFRDEGLDQAIAEIRHRQRTPGALEYLLLDVEDRTVVGDLLVDPPQPGWSTIYLPDASGEAASPDLIVLSEATPDGGRLIIAEDLERTEWVRYAILRTLFWIAAGALLLSLGAGYLAARGALSHMDGVFSAMERVGAGDLSARIPVRAARTDIDALGGRINAMLERVDGLVANLRRVSTDIAHDLRTPLTHVRQQLDDVAAATTLDAAKAAGRAAQNRIDDVLRTFAATLRLAEIESGATQARFAPVDLAAVIERVAHAYRPDIEGAGRSFTVDASTRATVMGDSDLLAQALANLLDNAVAHTPPNAAISVRLRADADGTRIEVEDNGPGVPAAERTRVLEPFVRLDRSRTSPGAGLGLSIVKAVARLHGAKLKLADARPGLRVELAWARMPIAASAAEQELSPPLSA